MQIPRVLRNCTCPPGALADMGKSYQQLAMYNRARRTLVKKGTISSDSARLHLRPIRKALALLALCRENCESTKFTSM